MTRSPPETAPATTANDWTPDRTQSATVSAPVISCWYGRHVGLPSSPLGKRRQAGLFVPWSTGMIEILLDTQANAASNSGVLVSAAFDLHI